MIIKVGGLEPLGPIAVYAYDCRKNATVGWLIGDAHTLTGNSHFRVLFARILQFTYCHRAIVSKSSKVFSLQMTTGS